MAPESLHSKGNDVGFMKQLFQRTFIHCTMVLPFLLLSLLLSFHLQIALRKVRNLQIKFDIVEEKVLINYMSCKFITTQVVCAISKIINTPAVAYTCYCYKSCTPKQIDLTNIFVTTAVLLCKHFIANKHMYVNQCLLNNSDTN